MGGEGSMLNANTTLKNNRSLLSKKKGKTGLSGSYSDVKLKDFPKATPKQLQELREKLQKENKYIKIKQFVVLSLILLLLTLVIVCCS